MAPLMDNDLDKLRGRLQALRAKTVANGCTEAEALAAAAKLAELLDRYDLSLDDLNLRAQRCEQRVLEINKRQRQAMAMCVGAIADFCDCKVWREKDPAGKPRYVLFGLPAGLEMAQSIHDVVAAALTSGWEAHQRTQRFIRHGDDERGSFLLGMAVSLAGKLTALKSDRRHSPEVKAAGRDLVLIRQDVVESEFAGLKLSFRQGGGSGKKVSAQAFSAGMDRGEGLDIPFGATRLE